MEDRSFRRVYLSDGLSRYIIFVIYYIVLYIITFILYIIRYMLSKRRFEVALAVSLQSTFSSTKFTRIKFSNSFQLKLQPGKV